MSIFYAEQLGEIWAGTKALVDGVNDRFAWGQANYWLGKVGELSVIIIELGCSVSLTGVTIRNAKNLHFANWGTKEFSIHLAEKSNGPWLNVLNGSLEDHRHLNPIPIKHFQTEINGKGKFVKFKAEAFYGTGAGLQYIDLHSNFFHDRWYEAKYALDQANCDQYTFDPANVGLGPEPLKQLDGFK